MALNILITPEKQNEKTVTLSQQVISSVCESVIVAMIDGLPEEAHTLEVFDHVLNESKEMIRNKVIKVIFV